MKKFNMFLTAIVFAISSAPAAFQRALRYGFGCPHFANGLEIGAGTHHRTTTKFTTVTITTRHLLYKFDTSDATGKKIVVCGAQDRAVFAVPDEVSATDIANRSPFPIEAIMLGVTSNSVRMISAGALNPGDVVYPAAAGQVNTYVGLGSTGTNYPCGVVLVGATAAGQIIEVAAMLEVQSATN